MIIITLQNDDFFSIRIGTYSMVIRISEQKTVVVVSSRIYVVDKWDLLNIIIIVVTLIVYFPKSLNLVIGLCVYVPLLCNNIEYPL